jgi:hypothetical protein
MDHPKPEWRKAWKIDDPEWLKERQRSWKRLKSSPVFKDIYKKYEMDNIRDFYVYGRGLDPEPPEEDWVRLTFHPDRIPVCGVKGSQLFQIWFSPDQNLQRWQEVIDQSTRNELRGCREIVRDNFRHSYPASGNLFGEREVLIYKYFGPTRFCIKDYEGSSKEDFLLAAASVYFELNKIVEMFFDNEYNAESIAPHVMPEFCDCLIPYCDPNDGNENRAYNPKKVARIVGKALEILQTRDDYHPEQVKAAQYMIDRLNDEDLEPKHLSPIKNAISDAGFSKP